MDVAYNQHSDRARRKNRSSTNINPLSLAPLTIKLPLDDNDDFPDPQPLRSTSYLQGKSAPTTPGLLSRSATPSRSRSHHRNPSAPSGPITKSKSSSHLAGAHARKPASGTATPRRRRDDGLLGPKDRNDGDWLLRTGALMSSEAREYKGQAWLVSRQSSTSLTGMLDADEEAFEQELARERLASRRGSSGLADDDATPNGSKFPSRFNSRSHSTTENRSHLGTPLDHTGGDGSYFLSQEASIAGPDFVNLDEKLEELERDTTQEDEAAVRRLVRRGHSGEGSWISNVIGWSLFSVDENDEESDDDDESFAEEDLARSGRSGWSGRHFEGVSNAPPLERIPPPATNEGGWKDAAWLLSVASKVVF
ncbi:hypothetical protein TOPH_02697 [Tolypocladium ophioglossoides CBS 100239]|uniref:Uncharacterized protein n=1 Tax=Tolypocladium ophioglossoides (strain CBS 100239) TaxID=1163406 RepID=A0A0L0NFL1_TOLOC|nr:hypothetical protein TOPH_02697 [Tolypocladium ophioglossoides CBS 100239]